MSLRKLYHKGDIFFPLLLFFVVIVLYITNYRPGTWLAGWDTLQPELNFPLYFKHILSVWQEHQGLGAPPAQAHLAELPRLMIYYPLSFILPLFILRFSYFFLTVLVGVLGVYFFILRAIFKKNEAKSKAAAFAGALFYLLNLGTVQHFIVPLEMFATAFAATGWLFLTAFNYLEKASKKNLLWFSLVLFFSAPMAHTATLWYIYFFFLSIFVFLYCLFFGKEKFKKLKSGAVLIVISILINAYWILPNLYYVVNHGKEMMESKINFLFSEEAFLQNVKYGTIKDLALFRNFLFSWNVYDFEKNIFVKLFGVWEAHFRKPLVEPLAYGLFILSILGMIISLIKRNITIMCLIPIFLISVLFWLNINSPVGGLFIWMQDNFPLFKEALRFPFTKFSIPLIFTVSVFLAVGVKNILKVFSKITKIKKGWILGLIVFSFIIIYIMKPAFQGWFISPYMQIKYPPEYFELFSWLNGQDKGRAADFPIHSVFGWQYYSWGYQGAGFLWFGLDQPLLDREFDRWYPANEEYNQEMVYAVYSRNLPLLEAVIEKYQISWLIIDENIINAGSPKVLYLDKLEQMIGNSSKIKLAKQFGKIKVYEVDLEVPIKDFVFLAENLPQAGPEYKWNNEDTAYGEIGNYSSDATNSTPGESACCTQQAATPGVYYPFRSLFTGRKQEELEFGVEDKGDYFVFRADLPEELSGKSLIINSENEGELMFWDENLESSLVTPEVNIESLANSSTNSAIPLRESPFGHSRSDISFEVRWPKKKSFYSYDSFDDIGFLSKEVRSCNPFNTGIMKQQIIGEKDKAWLRFESIGSSNCLDIDLPDLTHKIGYLVKVESRHIKGKQMLFSVVNKDSKRNEIESYLSMVNGQWSMVNRDFFIIPPMEEYGQGYELHFDNVSIGRQETVNDLGRVEVYPIPYRFLKELKIVDDSNYYTTARGSYLPVDKFQIEHPNPSFYRIKLGDIRNLGDLGESETLILSQAYHPGWISFSLDSGIWKPVIFDHLLVNNWENGWQIGDWSLADGLLSENNQKPMTNDQRPTTIYLFFWPQLLEYLGFGLLVGAGGWVVFRKD